MVTYGHLRSSDRDGHLCYATGQLTALPTAPSFGARTKYEVYDETIVLAEDFRETFTAVSIT